MNNIPSAFRQEWELEKQVNYKDKTIDAELEKFNEELSNKIVKIFDQSFIENSNKMRDDISKIKSSELSKFKDNIERLEEPYTDEMDAMEEFNDNLKLHDDVDSKITKIFSYLQDKYKCELNIEFFKYKIDSLDGSTVLQKIEIIKELMNRWQKILLTKQLKWKLNQIQKIRENMIDQLGDKIELYTKLSKNINLKNTDIGRLWNFSDGNWTKSKFDSIDDYRLVYENDKSLKLLVDMLGKNDIKDNIGSNSFELEQLNKYKSLKFGKEEFIGIKNGNKINYTLPSELSLLSDEILETLFYLKFSQKQLVTYDLISQISVKPNEIQSNEIDEYGPIIICIDTSGSMKGAPEQISKSIAYASVIKALSENRPCYLISFSNAIKSFEISKIKHLPQLVEFLSYSFNGGTSFDGPMKEVFRLLRTNSSFRKADVVIISDFVLGTLSNYTKNTIQSIKSENVKLHSLIINTKPAINLLDNFDFNWKYNPEKQNSLELISFP